jgi:hypothetical protein
MDKYIEAEKRLAELKGFFDIEESKLYGYQQIFMGRWGTEEKHKQHIPRWTRDDAAAFRLSVEHEVNITYYKDEVMVDLRGSCSSDFAHELWADHPDKATAVRYAIVQAVIAKLEKRVTT